MASSSIKTLSMGGNTYSLEDTQAREALSGKVDKVSGRGLSEDNYTTAEKSKLAGIAEGATANTGTVTGVKMNGVTKGTSGVVDLGTVITEHQDISGKQNTLVSGTNIRTINGQSLLGSGNITIEGGGGGGGGLTSEQVVTIVQDELDDYMPKFHLAVCDSSSTSTAKTVTIPGVTSLYDGLAIYIKNNSVESASDVKLNVNSLGAKPIYCSNTSATAITTHMAASGTYLLIYNSSRVSGGCWDLFVGYDANTTYANYSLGQGYGTCATAAATTAKVVTLSSYSLSTGGIVAVKFSNDVPASSTMNINSKGAKPIFYRGSAITANIIKAGDVATFIYNGTNYILLAVDRGVEQKTNLSDFNDDLGSSPTHTHSQYLTEHQTIKTINGQSLVGSGNITIGGGGEISGVSPDDAVTFCVQEIDVTSNILHYINFASDSARNYVVMNISNGIDTLTLTLDSENQCEHYVLLDNSSNEEDVVVALQTLQFDGEYLDKMIIPEDGISVPAKKYVELSYVVILSSLSVGVVTCSQVLTE